MVERTGAEHVTLVAVKAGTGRVVTDATRPVARGAATAVPVADVADAVAAASVQAKASANVWMRMACPWRQTQGHMPALRAQWPAKTAVTSNVRIDRHATDAADVVSEPNVANARNVVSVPSARKEAIMVNAYRKPTVRCRMQASGMNRAAMPTLHPTTPSRAKRAKVVVNANATAAHGVNVVVNVVKVAIVVTATRYPMTLRQLTTVISPLTPRRNNPWCQAYPKKAGLTSRHGSLWPLAKAVWATPGQLATRRKPQTVTGVRVSVTAEIAAHVTSVVNGATEMSAAIACANKAVMIAGKGNTPSSPHWKVLRHRCNRREPRRHLQR